VVIGVTINCQFLYTYGSANCCLYCKPHTWLGYWVLRRWCSSVLQLWTWLYWPVSDKLWNHILAWKASANEHCVMDFLCYFKKDTLLGTCLPFQ
jgi:hypothetical protein